MKGKNQHAQKLMTCSKHFKTSLSASKTFGPDSATVAASVQDW